MLFALITRVVQDHLLYNSSRSASQKCCEFINACDRPLAVWSSLSTGMHIRCIPAHLKSTSDFYIDPAYWWLLTEEPQRRFILTFSLSRWSCSRQVNEIRDYLSRGHKVPGPSALCFTCLTEGPRRVDMLSPQLGDTRLLGAVLNSQMVAVVDGGYIRRRLALISLSRQSVYRLLKFNINYTCHIQSRL